MLIVLGLLLSPSSSIVGPESDSPNRPVFELFCRSDVCACCKHVLARDSTKKRISPAKFRGVRSFCSVDRSILLLTILAVARQFIIHFAAETSAFERRGAEIDVNARAFFSFLPFVSHLVCSSAPSVLGRLFTRRCGLMATMLVVVFRVFCETKQTCKRWGGGSRRAALS